MILYYCLVGVVGLCIGSFLNVVIYRMPNKMSLYRPASHCTSCNEPIKWYDNIPLISYIVLRGRCRHCKDKISIRYFLVELLTGALWMLTYHNFGNTVTTIIYLIFITLLIVISFIDIDLQIIYDRFHLIIIALAALAITYEQIQGFDCKKLISHSLGFVGGGGILFLVGLLGKAVYKKDAMGGGDIKLMAVCGLLLGYRLILFSILASSIFVCLIQLPINWIKKENAAFPFAPYLALGMVLALFYGDEIINLYINLL